MKYPILGALVTIACLGFGHPAAAADTARDMYNRALAQERTIRDEASKPRLAQMRRVVAASEAVVRRHPASGYSDNALWQAANVSQLAFDRFGDEADRTTAARLLALLAKGYPSSKLAQGWLPPKVAATSTTAAPDSTAQKRAPATDPVPPPAAPTAATPGWLPPKVA